MDKNFSVIEECYQQYIKEVTKWIPDGVMEVDIEMLTKLGFLNEEGKEAVDPSLNRYFHVVETAEKITLINEQFVIWIVPENNEKEAVTLTLIALNTTKGLRLELAYVARGVYNTSQIVLRILEKILEEIQENEELLSKLKKNFISKNDA